MEWSKSIFLLCVYLRSAVRVSAAKAVGHLLSFVDKRALAHQGAIVSGADPGANPASDQPAPANSEPSREWLYATIGAVGGVVLLAILAMIIYCCIRRSRKRAAALEKTTVTTTEKRKSKSCPISTADAPQSPSTRSNEQSPIDAKKPTEEAAGPGVSKPSVDIPKPSTDAKLGAETPVGGGASSHKPSKYFGDESKDESKGGQKRPKVAMYTRMKPTLPNELKQT